MINKTNPTSPYSSKQTHLSPFSSQIKQPSLPLLYSQIKTINPYTTIENYSEQDIISLK